VTKLKVRARAVDMLGRQQIAGIPTAIHELFKNAHDAYAERAEVDFFRRTRVLVLRDDGYGMTLEDVEDRWLTLGTESRLDANKKADSESWTGPKCLPRRAIMGEKGIGRLAIAVIAPITLMLTRAARKDGIHPLTVSLVHWGLFEQPGIDISDIEIPVQQFDGEELPSREDICKMADLVQNNIEKIGKVLDPGIKQELINKLNLIREIAPDKLDKSLNANSENPLSLRENGCGTHFILLPVGEELDDDIDSGVEKGATKLERSLLGFSNSMSSPVPVILLEFRDHRIEGMKQLIGPAQFFTPSDYAVADHHFEGQINDFGQFVGKVNVYGKVHDFVCSWQSGKGRLSRCGPFDFKYAYIQGNRNETTLELGQWDQLKDKLDRIGGLYIYRDGIRVLPYGNSDYDFLDIELRRNKSFKDWFFSYRRGFGYVALTHKANESLSEKAGREGFRENQAYRDLQSILSNLFQQFAIEFFRENAAQGAVFNEMKGILKRQFELLEKQKKKADGRRSEFAEKLKIFFDCWENRTFEIRANEIKGKVTQSLNNIRANSDSGEAASALRSIEIEARASIRQLNNQIYIALPRGLSLTKTLERDWNAYQGFAQKLRNEVVQPFESEIITEIEQTGMDLGSGGRRNEVATHMINKQCEAIIKELMNLRRDALTANETSNQAIRDTLQEQFAKIRMDIEQVVDEFVRSSAANPSQIESLRINADKKLEEIRQRESSLFGSIQRQMLEIAESVGELETTDDRFAALEQRNQTVEEQLQFYAEFAQLGIAVGILQHEFERASRGFRASMISLKNWVEKNPKLASLYRQLKTHFDHLDGYLRALDPLGRKLNNAAIEISGEEILNTVRRVFDDPLHTDSINLLATKAFRAETIQCKSSAIISTFINIVDNAIYWVASRSGKENWILLDSKDGDFLISNSGPGIEAKLKERIFEFGETTKPGGRGMGLAVSREALHREGFGIELVATGRDENPVFRIFKLEEENAG
jgi:signal transduction histidine kinase